ncbi:hypothetical protein ACC734_38320, partial [Rhizobium ruizarguesonis]
FGIIPPAMVLGMVIFMLYCLPVAVSLAAVGLFFAIVGIATGHFGEFFLQALPLRFFGILSNDLLLYADDRLKPVGAGFLSWPAVDLP